MKLSTWKVWSVGCAAAMSIVACGKANPAQPSSTTGGSAGTSYVAPGGVSPSDKATVAFAQQPVTMIISNSVASSGQAVTYSFEVATDSGFAQKVFTRDGVASENGGVTHQAIDAKLPGNTTYYWHTKVTSGSSAGPFGPTYSFSIGPEIVVAPPVPLNPTANGKATGTPPALTTANAGRSGPATQITYDFQVSDSPSFGTVVFDGTAPEGNGQTSIRVTTPLAQGPTYYWRVQAIDASGVASGFSDPVPFTVLSFDINQALFVASPPDMAQWAQTTTITSVEFTDISFNVDFDRRTGPNAWPDLAFGDGGGGTLQYTLGMCGNIAGQWVCSAVVQFWGGRDLEASGPPWLVGTNWFYDSRWGPLHEYQPQDGEQVGLFVGSGNLRGNTFNLASCPQICERSDIHFVTWHNGGAYLERVGKPILSAK